MMMMIIMTIINCVLIITNKKRKRKHNRTTATAKQFKWIWNRRLSSKQKKVEDDEKFCQNSLEKYIFIMCDDDDDLYSNLVIVKLILTFFFLFGHLFFSLFVCLWEKISFLLWLLFDAIDHSIITTLMMIMKRKNERE